MPTIRLAAGLRPDPLGELKHSPRPSGHSGGLLLWGTRGGKDGKREREGAEGLAMVPTQPLTPSATYDAHTHTSITYRYVYRVPKEWLSSAARNMTTDLV